jgi:hypothetical protein
VQPHRWRGRQRHQLRLELRQHWRQAGYARAQLEALEQRVVALAAVAVSVRLLATDSEQAGQAALKEREVAALARGAPCRQRASDCASASSRTSDTGNQVARARSW